MSSLPNVVIIMARCRHSGQGFGIRFEEKSRSQWVGDWAFPVKEQVAKKEGYDRSEIRGTFSFDEAYPGCPHCGAKDLFKCHCSKVACWDGESRTVVCPWCKAKCRLTEQVRSLRAGNDL